MAEQQPERLLVQLGLGPDKLRQEQVRVDTIAQSELSRADVDDTTGATEQATAGESPAVDAQHTRSTSGTMVAFGSSRPMGDFQMGGTQVGGLANVRMGLLGPYVGWDETPQSSSGIPGVRKARMKSTPPATLAKRRREDAKFEAATQRRLKQEREQREADQEEIHRRQEDFIRKDRKARGWAKAIADDANYSYKSHLALWARDRAAAVPEVVEARRKLKQDGILRGMNPFPGVVGESMSREEVEVEEQEMREFLALQTAMGRSYFSEE